MVVAEVSADPDGHPQTTYVPCPNGCIGRIASCCDAAGSAQPETRDAVPGREVPGREPGGDAAG
jgi:hypothetical protein